MTLPASPARSPRSQLDGALSRLAGTGGGIGRRRRRHEVGSSMCQHFHHGRPAIVIVLLLSTCAATMLFKNRHRLSLLRGALDPPADDSSHGPKAQSLWHYYQQKAAMTQSQKLNFTRTYSYEDASAYAAINIVLTSDIHGRIRSTCIDEQDKKNKKQQTSPTACYPGAAYLSSVLSTVRSAAAGEAKEFTVLLDAGDVFFGDPNSNETIAAAMMNKLGYDAMALGNHEWDFGRQRLVDFARGLSFPILAGNIREATGDNDDGSVLPLKPYVQINLSLDITLCLLGVTAKEENPFAGPNVQISDEMEAVQHTIEEMSHSSNNCSATVLMSHAGIEVDRKIAREVRSLGLKVDAIVGGHSHVILGVEAGEAPLEEEFGIVVRDTKFPLRDSTKSNVPSVPVAHVGSAGYFVGLLRLTLRNTRNVDDGNVGTSESPDEPVQVDGELLALDENHGVRPDTSFHQWQSKNFPFIARFRGGIADSASSIRINIQKDGGATGIGGRPISKSTAICGQSCRTGECLLGNLISDSMKSCLDNGPCASALPSLSVRPAANIGLLESGTIRGCASSPFDDFSEILPWPNKLVILAMKGSVIRKMLNHGLHSMAQGGGGAFLQSSGLEYTYLNASVDDVFLSPIFHKASLKGKSKTDKARSVTFEIDEEEVNNVASCQVSSSVRGSRTVLSDSSLYFVIVTDWLASGGDGYKDLVAMADYKVELNETLSEALLLHTSTSSTVRVRIEGRSKRTADRNAPSALREGISAFLGGGVAFLLSYPLYTLFVRRSMAKSIKCSIRRLFDGCWLGFFASAVSDSLYFMVYHVEFLSPLSSFVRSSLASIINSLATTPLWVIVTHKQLEENQTGLLQITKAIYRERSICGFFDSITMNLLMCIFPVVRQLTLELTLRIFSIEEQNQIALAASLSSIVATVVTYPIQKARVMLQSGEEAPKVSNLCHYLYDGLLFKVLDTMLKTFLLFLVKEHSAAILCVLEV